MRWEGTGFLKCQKTSILFSSTRILYRLKRIPSLHLPLFTLFHPLTRPSNQKNHERSFYTLREKNTRGSKSQSASARHCTRFLRYAEYRSLNWSLAGITLWHVWEEEQKVEFSGSEPAVTVNSVSRSFLSSRLVIELIHTSNLTGLGPSLSFPSIPAPTEIPILRSPAYSSSKPTIAKCVRIAAGGNLSYFVVETERPGKSLGSEVRREIDLLAVSAYQPTLPPPSQLSGSLRPSSLVKVNLEDSETVYGLTRLIL